MKCFIFSILLISSSVVFGQSKVRSTDEYKIIGRWVSLDDKNYRVVFTKTLKLDYYSKELPSTFIYRINADSLIAKDKSDGNIYNYAILSLTKKYLTLMYLRKGNLLIFRKE
jgi:hypothetical protein